MSPFSGPQLHRAVGKARQGRVEHPAQGLGGTSCSQQVSSFLLGHELMPPPDSWPGRSAQNCCQELTPPRFLPLLSLLCLAPAETKTSRLLLLLLFLLLLLYLLFLFLLSPPPFVPLGLIILDSQETAKIVPRS